MFLRFKQKYKAKVEYLMGHTKLKSKNINAYIELGDVFENENAAN